MAFCGNCGSEIEEGAKFCPSCGETTTKTDNSHKQEESSGDGVKSKVYQDYSHLSEYYQQEFEKISDTNETYKGKWNWAAFFFSFLWAFSKGLWLPAIITVVGSFLTQGIFALICSIIFGIRGNYMFYNKIVKGEQKIF